MHDGAEHIGRLLGSATLKNEDYTKMQNASRLTHMHENPTDGEENFLPQQPQELTVEYFWSPTLTETFHKIYKNGFDSLIKDEEEDPEIIKAKLKNLDLKNKNSQVDTIKLPDVVILDSGILHGFAIAKSVTKSLDNKLVESKSCNGLLQKDLYIWELFVEFLKMAYPKVQFVILSPEYKKIRESELKIDCNIKARIDKINENFRTISRKIGSKTNIHFLTSNLKTVRDPIEHELVLGDATHLHRRFYYEKLPGSLWADSEILWNFICRRKNLEEN